MTFVEDPDDPERSLGLEAVIQKEKYGEERNDDYSARLCAYA